MSDNQCNSVSQAFKNQDKIPTICAFTVTTPPTTAPPLTTSSCYAAYQMPSANTCASNKDDSSCAGTIGCSWDEGSTTCMPIVANVIMNKAARELGKQADDAEVPLLTDMSQARLCVPKVKPEDGVALTYFNACSATSAQQCANLASEYKNAVQKGQAPADALNDASAAANGTPCIEVSDWSQWQGLTGLTVESCVPPSTGLLEMNDHLATKKKSLFLA